MNSFINKFLQNIFSLHRYSKRLLAIIFDAIVCILCTWVAFLLRSQYWILIKPELDQLILFEDISFVSLSLSSIIAIPIFWIFGLYRTIFRYTGFSIFFTILKSSIIYAVLYFAIAVYIFQIIPRPIGFFQPILIFFTILGSRLIIKLIFAGGISLKKSSNKKKVLVYGAGDAGRQLVSSLENSLEYKVVGFLDDNKQYHKQILLGYNVYSPAILEKLIKSENINLVFLALPAIGRNERNNIIEKLNKYKLVVQTLPSISQILDGKITVSDIKEFNIDDLLSRQQVKPDAQLMNKNIYLKTVLVTGAGGSIGSELCRQIIKLKPNKLILLELNEFALYKIYEELIAINKDLKIISLIANVQDQTKIEIILETFRVNTVYHAAAYKHVPLVEENICEGVKNNVFGTLAVAKASVIKKVENLVLISSDKAVRPTNIMGASKRLSELCLQGICNKNKNFITNFSIVRFGNVLESSGSVIPKFKRQIKEGGPVTLTHKDITRYFMTVTEAAELVIQAGAMGAQSEVFVLDMGKSVKIKNLIIKMINLSGFTIKDKNNPNGDIEIKVTGLRTVEKLYEELLIGDNPKKTNHPKIFMINEPFIPFAQLEKQLNNLLFLLKEHSAEKTKIFLEKLLKNYQSNSNLIDHIYLESVKNNTENKVPKFIK